MSFRSIRETQTAVWPAVRASLDRHRANREATRADPRATEAAKRRAERPWSRVVSEETVWALTKQGFLCTPEQAAVVKAAQEWGRSWDKADGPPDEMDAEEDVALYAAVQSLASAIDTEALDEVG